MRGGTGTVQIMHVFEQEELQGKCRLLARVTLEPNTSIGPHPHDSEEEVYSSSAAGPTSWMTDKRGNLSLATQC